MYIRVIPRDFFNEAKLLKCMGQLSLAILDCKVPQGIELRIEENGDPFEIRLSDDGNLHVANYETFVNGRVTTFYTHYNSKLNYPFYCINPESSNEVKVFDEDGKWTEEFLESC